MASGFWQFSCFNFLSRWGYYRLPPPSLTKLDLKSRANLSCEWRQQCRHYDRRQSSDRPATCLNAQSKKASNETKTASRTTKKQINLHRLFGKLSTYLWLKKKKNLSITTRLLSSLHTNRCCKFFSEANKPGWLVGWFLWPSLGTESRTSCS